MAIFKRMNNETPEEFIYRISSMKTEHDWTWDDVADICNEELNIKRSESYYRKRFSKRLLDDILQQDDVTESVEQEVSPSKTYFDNTYSSLTEEEFNALSSQEQSDLYQAVAQKLREVQSEKVRVADERNYNNFLLRRISREDSLKDIALAVAKQISTTKVLPDPVVNKNVTRNNKKAGILVISDWHYGIMIDNVWNKFDPEIATERISYLLDETLAKCVQENISELYVVNLGDMIAGRIHAQIRIQSRYDVITQTINVTEILAEFLSSLANNLDKVHYYSCWDNHSRIEPNKKESLDLETFARFIPWYLKPRLAKYQNIEINDNRFGMNIISFNCLGHHIGGVHGDKDKPNRVVENITLYTQERFDMLLTAHLHHFSCDEKNETLIVSNGSLMGTDDFAESLRVNSKPSQNFIVVSEDNVAEEIHRIIL